MWERISLFGRPAHYCVPSLTPVPANETQAQRFDALSGEKLDSCRAGQEAPHGVIDKDFAMILWQKQGKRYLVQEVECICVHAGEALTKELQEGKQAFDQRFQQVFGNAQGRSQLSQGRHHNVSCQMTVCAPFDMPLSPMRCIKVLKTQGRLHKQILVLQGFQKLP